MAKEYNFSEKFDEILLIEIDLNVASLYSHNAGAKYPAFNRAKEREVAEVIEISEGESQEEFDRKILYGDADNQEDSQRQKQEITLSFALLLEYSINAIYYLGDITISSVKSLLLTIVPIFVVPLITAFSLIAKTFVKVISKILQTPKKTVNKLILVQKDLQLLHKRTRDLTERKKRLFAKSVSLYFLRSFKIHRNFWLSLFNWCFPIAILIFLLPTLMPDSTQIYALEVYYNDTSIGYVESEDVFESASISALAMFGSTDETMTIEQPYYELTKVSLNELSSSSMISENIIQASTQDYALACGIYIDGEFLCATKNESDATSVFASILQSYETTIDGDVTVAFVEEIEFVQQYYPVDSELIWDSLTLKSVVTSTKTDEQLYIVEYGDTIDSISAMFDISTELLQSQNPDVDFGTFKAGDVLCIQKQTNYLRVKEMITQTRTRTIEYETIEEESSSLYEGTTKTTQEGENGSSVITELVTYIDGVEAYTYEISTVVTVEPVDEIIEVGTKEKEGVNITATSSGFIWPCIGAYSVSSGYGYRTLSGSYDLHKGVDIVKASGYSTGTPIVASAAGTVTSVVYGTTGYGYCVIIDHGSGYTTRYAHMLAGSITVSVGDYVEQGQQIGQIGSTGDVTGPHLHFEIMIYGSTVDPLNYISY